VVFIRVPFDAGAKQVFGLIAILAYPYTAEQSLNQVVGGTLLVI